VNLRRHSNRKKKRKKKAKLGHRTHSKLDMQKYGNPKGKTHVEGSLKIKQVWTAICGLELGGLTYSTNVANLQLGTRPQGGTKNWPQTHLMAKWARAKVGTRSGWFTWDRCISTKASKKNKAPQKKNSGGKGKKFTKRVDQTTSSWTAAPTFSPATSTPRVHI